MSFGTASLTDSHRTKGRRNAGRLMQHLAEISRDSVSPLPFPLRAPSADFLPLPSPFARSFCLSFLRLPFRPVIPPPANYAVVVASCHVIKLHLFTMKRDCHQAFDSRAVSHRRFHSVCVDRLPSTDRPRVPVIIHAGYTHVIFKSASNDPFKTLSSSRVA